MNLDAAKPVSPATAIAAGGASGTAATAAMSAVMWLAQRVGLMGQQPPQRLAERALGRRHRRGSDKPADAAAAAAHVAFGAGAGAVYGAVRQRLPRELPGVVAGVAFGLLVWAVSYRGWMPVLGILPPPDRDRPGRPTSMIVAHVVYGASLGGLLDALLARRRR